MYNYTFEQTTNHHGETVVAMLADGVPVADFYFPGHADEVATQLRHVSDVRGKRDELQTQLNSILDYVIPLLPPDTLPYQESVLQAVVTAVESLQAKTVPAL